MFSHKSNFLQFVFQQQICFQFQMPLFKNDLLPFEYNRTSLILSDMLANIYQYSLALSPLSLR